MHLEGGIFMTNQNKRRFQLKLKATSIGTQNPDNINKVQKCLTRYGYHTATMSLGILDKPNSEALKRQFQQVRGLKAKGQLDAQIKLSVLIKKHLRIVGRVLLLIIPEGGLLCPLEERRLKI